MLKIVTSQVVPIPRSDIDTDQIIPAEFLTVTGKNGLGRHLFARVRASEKDFESMAKFSNGEILVTRKNFGCGSSREHAAWALHDWGVRVVIAPSFADIFYSNALKNGILPVVLTEVVVEEILTEALRTVSYEVTVDLPTQTVTLPDGTTHAFEIDSYLKSRLIEGTDDMDYLVAHLEDIKNYDKKHRKHLFFKIEGIT